MEYVLRRNYNGTNNGLPQWLTNDIDSSIEKGEGERCLVKVSKSNLYFAIRYLAPERLSKHPYNHTLRKKSDLMAIAETLNILYPHDK